MKIPPKPNTGAQAPPYNPNSALEELEILHIAASLVDGERNRRISRRRGIGRFRAL